MVLRICLLYTSVDTFAQLLVGNVVLRHKDATMYCDSAKLYQEQNRFEGFGSVRIEQGDSLEITCNSIDYTGMNLLARLRESVVMNHGDNHLYTDSLDYDRKTGLGYYFDTRCVEETALRGQPCLTLPMLSIAGWGRRRSLPRSMGGM